MTAAGVATGTATAVVELVFLLVVGVSWLPRRAVPAPVLRGAERLVRLERRRLARYFAVEAGSDEAPARALHYLAARWTAGLLGGLVLATVVAGALYGTVLTWVWIFSPVDDPWTLVSSDVGGLFLLFLGVQGMYAVVSLEDRLARRFLGPSEQELLQRRISELAASRAAVVEAVHDERRRIERYLHDGLQQRLVALGMLLGRARRAEGGEDSARSSLLLRQAHEESRRALEELREVAWRVYPSVLDEAGLRAALETVAERSGGMPVRLEYGLTEEPGDAVRTAAYFVVCEAVTNAVKHAGASGVTVRVRQENGRLSVRVEDDGCGGADPSAGGGLLGLARRLAALDGTLTVTSPPGGPTAVTAELPCA